VRRVLVWVVPAAVAVLLFAFAMPAYARLLGLATSWVRSAFPPAAAHVSVVVRGAELVVQGDDVPKRVDVESIAWNLPVLLCLWGWVVRGRWSWLAIVALGFVGLHVLMAEISVRVALGEGSGWPLGALRGWVHGGAAALPLIAVALAFARRSDPPIPRLPSTEREAASPPPSPSHF
jgi:hypothetical protein